MTGIDTLFIKVLDNKIAKLIVGDTPDEPRLEAVVRHAHGNVRRGTPNVFLEVVHVLQRLEVLLHVFRVGGVEVDCDATEQDDVEGTGLVKVDVYHDGITPVLSSEWVLLSRAIQ